MKHLNSCCFNLSESPSDCFHMVTWLTTRADCISRLVAANKLLSLFDPVCVSVCVAVFASVFVCLVVCLSLYACSCVNDPRLHVFKKENEIHCGVFSSTPTVNHSVHNFTCTSLRHFVCSPCCTRQALETSVL